MTQLAPTLRVVPQVVLTIENRFALVPVILPARLRRAAVPVFLMVSANVLVVPLCTNPKLRVVGLSETTGAFTVCETPADVLVL
jgi:hypothetical protein